MAGARPPEDYGGPGAYGSLPPALAEHAAWYQSSADVAGRVPDAAKLVPAGSLA